MLCLICCFLSKSPVLSGFLSFCPFSPIMQQGSFFKPSLSQEKPVIHGKERSESAHAVLPGNKLKDGNKRWKGEKGLEHVCFKWTLFSANFVSLANEFIITLPVDRSFARTAEGLKIRKLKQISVNAKAWTRYFLLYTFIRSGLYYVCTFIEYTIC